jgi:hypothetical protein
MSSIEHRQKKALVAFYRENLASLREKASFPEIEPGVVSYWRRREWQRLERKDFEITLGSADEAAATLDRFWTGSALEGLGRKLAKLSRQFPDAVEKSDVSPLIYEMF